MITIAINHHDYYCLEFDFFTHANNVNRVIIIISAISRSQWSSGSMLDCSAWGPGIESRCGQLWLS